MYFICVISLRCSVQKVILEREPGKELSVCILWTLVHPENFLTGAGCIYQINMQSVRMLILATLALINIYMVEGLQCNISEGNFTNANHNTCAEKDKMCFGFTGDLRTYFVFFNTSMSECQYLNGFYREIALRILMCKLDIIFFQFTSKLHEL